MAVSPNYAPARAQSGVRRHTASAWTAAEIAVEMKMPVERVRNMMSDVKSLSEKRPAQYAMRDFLDRFVERALEAQGSHSKTVTSAKRRTEEARAEKLEIGNAVDKKVLVHTDQIIPAMIDFVSILARALDASVMRIKRKYPDIKSAHLSAFEENMAIARNTAIDNFGRLADEQQLSNKALWDAVRLKELERLEMSRVEHEQMERMLQPTVVEDSGDPDEW